MAYQTGFRTTLAKPLGVSATEMIVATAPTVTKGRLYLKSGSKEEWIAYDGISGTTLQNLTRGLSKTSDPATGGTGQSWIAGTPVKLVAMHDQLIDKSEPVVVSDLRFNGTTTSGLRIKSLTTTQRNAITASNGDIVYDSTLGENYQYIGGAWSAVSAGSTQSNASTTIAGKVEVATDAEITSGALTGGTGAVLSVTPAQLKKSISLKTAGTTFGDTNEISVNISGEDVRITGANLRESIPASTTQKGTIEIATDAEVATGTDTSRATTPAQLESTRKVAILQGTRNIGDATGTQVIAHGLGFTPKWIEVTAYTSANTRQMNINGYSNGSINMCSGQNFNYNISNDLYPFNNSSNVIYLYIDLSSGAGDWLTRATATFDATNITLNWTTTGTSNPGGVIYYTILAHS